MEFFREQFGIWFLVLLSLHQTDLGSPTKNHLEFSLLN